MFSFKLPDTFDPIVTYHRYDDFERINEIIRSKPGRIFGSSTKYIIFSGTNVMNSNECNVMDIHTKMCIPMYNVDHYIYETNMCIPDWFISEFMSVINDVGNDTPTRMTFRGQHIAMYPQTAVFRRNTFNHNGQWEKAYQSHQLGTRYHANNVIRHAHTYMIPKNTIKNRIMYALRGAAVQAALNEGYDFNPDIDLKGLEFPDGCHNCENIELIKDQ